MKRGLKNERLHHIDMLRGIAMFVMILIHTNAYFLSNKTARFLWDLSQFAVPVFIFCSAYLFFYKDIHFRNKKEVFNYVKKRFFRLLVPYYVFAFIFMEVIFLKEPQKLTANYIFQTLTVTGGIDINWLVLLFLYFALLMPVIKWIIDKKRVYFYLFCFLSFLSSIVFLFHSQFSIINYRLTMWLPWSFVLIIGYLVIQNERKRWFLPFFGVVSFILFFILRQIQLFLNHSLVMYDNKYPPNLFHLSYGMFFLVVLIYLAHTKLFKSFPLTAFFGFLSRYSYPLYFIHYTIIFILMLFFHFKFTWVSFFIAVLTFSLIIQSILNLRYRFSTLNKGPTI